VTSHFRAHSRRPVRLAAAVRSQRTGVAVEGLLVDLSLAGACIETGEPMAPGDHVTVALVTPTLWDPLEVSAAVAWATTPTIGIHGDIEKPARAGLAFHHTTPASTYALMEVLAAQGAGFE
jgi:hypothetical protein